MDQYDHAVCAGIFFDPDFSNATIEEQKASEECHRKYIKHIDQKITEDVALELPLRKLKRPEWDFTTLAPLGAHKLDVELYGHISVPKGGGKKFYAKSFVLRAQK